MPSGHYMRKAPEVRFWEKVEKTDSCWLWIGATNVAGYGVFGWSGKVIGAHRISYEIIFGNFDLSLHVLHRCDNPPCVNPDHLFLGTPRDNTEDKCRKGRQAFGIRFGSRVKLTPDIVKEIRNRALTERQPAIAAAFGVSQSLISLIIRRKLWNHL